MSGLPLTACRRWLNARLKADYELNDLVGRAIYSPRVPATAEYPCVLFAYQALGPTGAGATATVPPGRPIGTYHFVVQAIVNDGQTEVAETIAKALERLLAGASGAVAGYEIERVWNVEPVEIPETDEDVEYYRLGAVYAIALRQA